MKKVIQLVILSVLISVSAFSQEVNAIQKDPKTGNDMIVGEVTREGLMKLPSWSTDEYKFSDEYQLYSPDSASISYLNENKSDLPYVFVVLGTWCGDSKDQLPRFLKIADIIGYPAEKVFMVAVDRDKKGGSFCLADFEITLVPTFIFTSKGEEIGRIIESPQTTLEQDLVNLMKVNRCTGLK
ncbi:MAG TPA: thioredoxin family protein [Lentimicrobium sp.]|nr:thioredoxin family protein [Lentimicrobium sp.]